jgi:4-amino-4-deoxy-L-arabinose transferase-like glycosyltransferase
MVRWVHVLGLAAFLVAEFAGFQGLCSRAAWIYPRWYDQLQYLTESYKAFEYSLDHGLWGSIWHTLKNPPMQGVLHGICTLPVFRLFGASRAMAYEVNMLWFLALQAFTWWAVRRATKANFASWLSVAFFVALACPWAPETGSIIDFRLDWMAACAYGIALACVVAGDGFRSVRWAAAIGVAVGVALLTRYLTAVYFIGIFFAFLAYLVARPDRWRRCSLLLLSALLAVAVAGPVFWINRGVIYNYYWVGHVSGPERALRDSNFGLFASVRWIAKALGLVKIGVPALALCASTLGLLWGLASAKATGVREVRASADSLRRPFGAALVFLLVPAGVLTLHPEKAPQTVNIMLPSVVWIAALSCEYLARRVRPCPAAWATLAALASGGIIMACFLSRVPYTDTEARDTRTLDALSDFVYFRSEEKGLDHPRIAASLYAESISAPAFELMGYERHHRFIDFVVTLPTGLFEIPDEVAMKQLGSSDFVCLLRRPDVYWPYDRQMMSRYSSMRSWCDTNLARIGDLQASGFSVSVYEQRDPGGANGPGAVDLSTMLRDEGISVSRVPPAPPSAPYFVSKKSVMWGTHEDFVFQARAAYSPVTYSAKGLPEGLWIDPRSGTIRGSVAKAGKVTSTISAENSRGSTDLALDLDFRDGDFLVDFALPARGRVGVPIPVAFDAFSSAATLDFIDLSDLSTRKMIGRLPAGDEEHRSWELTKMVTFTEPGDHLIVARFVCFDPAAKQQYSFVDRSASIHLEP